MQCPRCERNKVKFFSVYGRMSDGYTVSKEYTSCKDCVVKLIDETVGKPAKVLRLDTSIIDREFRRPVDQKQMKDFIKMVLGL